MANDREEERKIRIGKEILSEDDLEIQAPYKSDIFILKYPNPILRSQIEMETARRLGGYPRSSYSADYLLQLEMNVTVDLLYVSEKCPDWYEGPFEDFDEERTLALYNRYLKFRDTFRRRLRAGRSDKSDKRGSS